MASAQPCADTDAVTPFSTSRLACRNAARRWPTTVTVLVVDDSTFWPVVSLALRYAVEHPATTAVTDVPAARAPSAPTAVCST